MKDYKTAWNFLDNKTKKTFYFIVFLFIILSFLELLSVASIIPFTAAIFNPSSLSSIEVLKDFSSFLEKNQNILVPIFCLIFFILFLFKNLFSIFIYKFINFFVSNLKALVGKKLLTKFFNQDYLFFMTSKQGKLITLLSSETEILASNFFHAAMIFISEIFILIALFILIILTGNIKGILIGGFTDMTDLSNWFLEDSYELIAKRFYELPIPIAFGFPAGHTSTNTPLLLGAKYSLTVDKSNSKLELL